MSTLAWLVVVGSSAFANDVPGAPYEGDEPGECTDRADNDRDTRFDCHDEGCMGSPDCTAAKTAARSSIGAVPDGATWAETGAGGASGSGGSRPTAVAAMDRRERDDNDGSLTVGDPVILGALDVNAIDEEIARKSDRLRYCLQRERVDFPALAGTVVVKFVIAKDGTVSSATTKSTTLNNADAEDCLNGQFMRMEFPKPRGGGIVIASYPLNFAPPARK
jgi:hypothetical protein